jgi:hypothetical protein
MASMTAGEMFGSSPTKCQTCGRRINIRNSHENGIFLVSGECPSCHQKSIQKRAKSPAGGESRSTNPWWRFW